MILLLQAQNGKLKIQVEEKEKQEEIIKELKEMRKKMEEECIEQVAKVKLDKDKLIEKVEMLQVEISNIDTYKIEVKRLEEELLA